MEYPFSDLAKRLRRNLASRRTAQALEDVQTDEHIAHDIGLPHRPRKPRRIELW